MKVDASDIFIRKADGDPWHPHYSVLRDGEAARRLQSRGLSHAPYSTRIRYPIDPTVASALKSLGIKEVVVGPDPAGPEEAEDLLDLTPLAGAPLESLFLEPRGEGKLAIKGLGEIRGLQSLVIQCYKNEAFPLSMVKACTSIRYLNVFASNLDLDADPRVFGKLTYCRISAGKPPGLGDFVQGVAAEYVHLEVYKGLAELGPKVSLSPSVKHLLIEHSLDLKDVSPLKASAGLAELKIRDCRWLGSSDGFRRPSTSGSLKGVIGGHNASR